MAARSVPELLVSLLRASGITGIDWGDRASPYYEQAPEPPHPFPFVVVEIGETRVSWQTNEVAVEAYPVAVRVVCEEPDVAILAVPYVPGSVIAYLDALQAQTEQLATEGFDVARFARTSYLLTQDTMARSPGGGRVWIATARYDLQVSSWPPIPNSAPVNAALRALAARA